MASGHHAEDPQGSPGKLVSREDETLSDGLQGAARAGVLGVCDALTLARSTDPDEHLAANAIALEAERFQYEQFDDLAKLIVARLGEALSGE